jgi:hypothetical protein
MKASNWDGWNQLELDDVIEAGDVWLMKGNEGPPNDDEISIYKQGETLQQVYMAEPGEMAFDLFRKARQPIASSVPTRARTHKTQILPLP